MTASPPAGRSGVTRFAGRGHARLAYETTGATGPAVVLLHDLLGDRSAVAGLRDALAATGFRVVAPDARGHGASAAVAGRRYPIAELVADVQAVLDAEAIARVHAVGHGLGGATALALALRSRERVVSLALIEPTVVGILADDPDPAARWVQASAHERARTAADLADRGATDRALDALLDPRWGRGWRERLPRPRQAAIRRHGGALAPLLSALDAFAPPPDELRRVNVPALVVATDAASANRVVAERLAAVLASARLATVPPPADPVGSPVDSDCAALANLLVDFLTEVEESAAPGSSGH